MKNLKNQPHCWPLLPPRNKRNHYGHEAPVEPLILRIVAAVKKQLENKDNREEALVTMMVVGVVALCLLGFFVLLPGAIWHEIDHSRSVVAESLK